MSSITVNEAFALGAPLVLLLIVIEAIFSHWKQKEYYNVGDTLATIGLLVGNMVTHVLIKGGTLGLHFYLYQFRIIDLIGTLPTWSLWLITIILIDLVFYFYHRLSHRSRFLWAVHMSHHSSEEMNFAVSFRQAWFGPISKIPFFIVLPLMGLDPTMIAVGGVLSTLWGVVGHTQMIGTLGPVEWIFNTPSHHRVHHGSNPEYIDKNYGNVFIIWDRIFGTFEPERAPVKYGLVKNVETYDPVKITFMEWQSLFRDMYNANSIKEALAYFFNPPSSQVIKKEDSKGIT